MTSERQGTVIGTPDAQLVEAACRGNVDSFVELCGRYYPAMVAIACAVLGDHHLAEDAAQEALAKAYGALPTLKDPSCFAPWAVAICRHNATDMARRIPKAESLGDRDVPAKAASISVEVEAVRDAIGHLPSDAKEIVYLRYYDELSYDRLSAVLGISEQAVNGRLRRARQTVREYLMREDRTGGNRHA
jgi:RNA polymerase sigma-70 factor, ECF subfamily